MTWSRCPKNDRRHKPTTGVPASGHMVEVSRRLWREEMRARCRGVEEDEEERLAMRKNLKLEQLHQAVSSSAWNWLNCQPKLPYWSTLPPPSSCPQGQSFPPSPLPLPPSALGKLTPLVSSSAPLSWSPWNRPPWWRANETKAVLSSWSASAGRQEVFSFYFLFHLSFSFDVAFECRHHVLWLHSS